MSRENRHGQGLMSHPASDNPPPESAALLKVLLLLDPTEQPSAFSCLLVVQGRIVPDEQRNIAGGFLAMYIPNSRETGSFHFKTREGGYNYVRVDFGLSWMLCIRTPGGERGEEQVVCGEFIPFHSPCCLGFLGFLSVHRFRTR